MPAIQEEVDAAEEEGAKFIFLAAPHRIVGEQTATSRPSRSSRPAWASTTRRAAAGRSPPTRSSASTATRVILAVGETVDTRLLPRLRSEHQGKRRRSRSTATRWRPAASKFYAGGDLITRRFQRVQRHGLRQEGGAQHRPAADGRSALRRSSFPSSSTTRSRPPSPARAAATTPHVLPAGERAPRPSHEAVVGLCARGSTRGGLPLPALRHPRQRRMTSVTTPE